jgi:photosystem II stability/assembly factor-like uncharacterized protein
MPLYGESGWGECRYGLAGGCLPETDWFQIAYDSLETDILSITEFDSVLYAGSSPNGIIYKSLNGTTWTLAYDSPEASINDLVVFNGDLFAATGPNGLILRSVDGTTWTIAYDTPQTDIRTFKVFGGYLYAGGDDGIIYRSSDGATWTLAYDSPESTVYDLEVFNSSLYAATGNSGLIYSSTDGTTWTLAYDSPQTTIKSLAAMGGDYPSGVAHLLAGGGDVGFIIYKSTDGTTWELAYDGLDTIGGVLSMYGTNAMVYAGSELGGVLYRSDNTLDWSISYDSPATRINVISPFSLNCKMYLGTGVDGIIYSMDNLVQKDLIPDVVAPDGGETITTDTFIIQFSMEQTDYTNIVWDVEYTRDYSTFRTWIPAEGGTDPHIGHNLPLTGISIGGGQVTQVGNYLEVTWNVLPIVDSTDVKIRIRARDTSSSGCTGYSSWNESDSTFTLQNGPC